MRCYNIRMNIIEELDIKKIVEQKAKYQKVLLVYDETVSNIGIQHIYEMIKELCIFNKVDISSNEDIMSLVNDGYRAVIYICSTDNFLKISINRQDFVNIYLPTDSGLLPYFLTNTNELENSADYLVLNTNIDTSAMCSLYFNKVFNFLRNLFTMSSNKIQIEFPSEITNAKIIEEIESIADSEMFFVDMDIAKKCDISYSSLPLVDYILLTALLTLVRSVKQHSLSMVDVYKSAGEDYALIDRFYAMYNNESLIGLINLNFFYISNMIERTRDKLLEILPACCEYDKQTMDSLMLKIKEYSKQDNGIIGYLYLYNIFSV